MGLSANSEVLEFITVCLHLVDCEPIDQGIAFSLQGAFHHLEVFVDVQNGVVIVVILQFGVTDKTEYVIDEYIEKNRTSDRPLR